MADNDARLPVRALATDVTVEVANAAGTTINPVEEFAQGSTTTGQNGPLVQGAVTTAAPTYVTGQTAPFSLTTTGELRVNVNEQDTLELFNYNTAAAVAAGASNTHSFTPGSTINLDGFHVAASGQAKWEIQWGTTGSETSKFVSFTSKSNQTFDFELKNPVQITTAMTIKIIRTNNEPALAQDLYSTISYH